MVLPVIIIISYLLGATPWALIITKITTGKDIRREGSGNIGAMNSYEVTGKKWIGIVVTILDAAKGSAAAYMAIQLQPEFLSLASAVFFVILGHNFNIFLKFRGGRGLATALGASLIINPVIALAWAWIWFLSYFIIRKNIHVDNSVATILLPPFLSFIPENIFLSLQSLSRLTKDNEIIIMTLICVLILIRHINPMARFIRENFIKTS
jgi:glycerol-3-phosphate acyltransferase PlsY